MDTLNSRLAYEQQTTILRTFAEVLKLLEPVRREIVELFDSLPLEKNEELITWPEIESQAMAVMGAIGYLSTWPGSIRRKDSAIRALKIIAENLKGGFRKILAEAEVCDLSRLDRYLNGVQSHLRKTE